MSSSAYLVASVALVAVLVSLAVTGTLLRRCLLPGWQGPPGWVAATLLALAAAVLPALVLGTFGLLHGWSWFGVTVAGAALLWRYRHRLPRIAPGGGAAPPPVGDAPPLLAVAGLAVAAAAFGLFTGEAAVKLGTGMTVFDTNWYHGPLAVAIAESGNTAALHHVAPAFFTWFYPQTSELVHALGILLYGNDLLSLFLNVGWFAGCLVAGWAVGRPYGGAPVSLAGVALVLGSVAMADQAGEARNDIVGAFFVLAGLAVLVNGTAGGRRLTPGPAVVIGLAAGFAAGTKINFIPAAVVLLAAVVWLAAPGQRRRIASGSVLAALATGGYWYLRNLVQGGNPLPWLRHIGPWGLPGPDQELGGRQAGSVLGYLGNTEVIRDWFLPGLREAFGPGWVVVLLLALTAALVCLLRRSDPGRRAGGVLVLALFLAWLAAPTSASGSPGVPGGFFTGLRYLAPALICGMALLGAAAGPCRWPGRAVSTGLLLLLAPFTIAAAAPFPALRYQVVAVVAGAGFLIAGTIVLAGRRLWPAGSRRRTVTAGLAAAAAVILIFAGLPVQRYYFNHRYASAEYVTPGLAASFAWARGIEGARIGTTASRQYPYFGVLLGNRVGAIGTPRPHGGFVTPKTCPEFRRAVNRGRYRYLVTALDRFDSKRRYPFAAGWTASDPAARELLRRPGAAVFEINGRLDPAGCR